VLKNTYFKKLSGVQQNVYKQVLNGICTRQGKIRVSQLPDNKLIEYLSMDHPELFYCDFNSVLIEQGVFGCFVKVKYTYTEAQCKQIIETAKRIADLFRTLNEEETARNIHNYLVKNIRYDYADISNIENHNIVGPIVNGKGVCEGIAKTMQYILNLCGIDNTVIIGYLENEPHMWNIVSINGYNYHIDVTSDISLTEQIWQKPGYFYYLISDKEIKKTHQFTENFNCVQVADNPFYKTNRLFYDDRQLVNFIREIRSSQKLIYFKYFGDKSSDEILELITDNLHTFGLFSRIYMKENVGTFYVYR